MINLSSTDTSDYICITDMAKAKDGDARAADIITFGHHPAAPVTDDWPTDDC
jgi:hypothetical protein